MNSKIEDSIAQNLVQGFCGKSKLVISKNFQAFGFTRQTIKEKINSLRKQKIIKNITININPHIRPDYLKYILLEIKTNPTEPKLVNNLLKIPQIKMLDGIFGEFSLIALLIFKSSDEYFKVLKKIDEIMANSYFKKYQIIETIKVYKTNGIDLKDKIVEKDFKLDENDYKILKILQENQGIKPISTYEIKDLLMEFSNIEISQSTVHNRIKILEQKGVILNYSISFNPRKIGFNGKYLLRIKPKNTSKYDHFAEDLARKEEITDLFRIGEQYGLFAIVRVKKIEDYAAFIRDLYNSEEIEDTFTNFVLDELKPYTNFLVF
ncbi:MAG: Lrp/AsnC family transcriptional regulator [Candidatus Hermodarchaeota archaeon]